MILPNLVIAGTPKSGTSSLFRWLSDHPQICPSVRKETRFLLDRADPLFVADRNYLDQGLEAYVDLFPPEEREAAPVLLEATPHYLYQQTALEVLSTLPGKPHVVVLLRRPSDRIESSFRYTQQNLGLLPRRLTFSEYVEQLLAAESSGEKGSPGLPVVYKELRYSRYADYLREWMARIESNRLNLVLFEEFTQSPRDCVQRLCDALDINAGFFSQYEFARFNESVSVRRPELQQSARRLARLFPTGRLKAAMKGLYLKLQRRRQPALRSDADREALRCLDEYFESANGELAELLGRDLSVWKSSDQTAAPAADSPSVPVRT